MIYLLVIIFFIIGAINPELFAKGLKDAPDSEEKKLYIKSLRKIYSVTALIFAAVLFSHLNAAISTILLIVSIILLFAIAIPACKECLKLKDFFKQK